MTHETTKFLTEIDRQVKYGFELALKYAKMAKQNDKDIIKMLEEVLDEWSER